MPLVRIKGLNRVKTKLSDGTEVVYWYAWKGGPRLDGKPGSAVFIAAYNAAVADRKSTPAETLRGLVGRYKGSPEWLGLSDATRGKWARWLDKLSGDNIGDLTFRMLDDRRVRADLLEWRDQWGSTPRTADYAVQVLSRVLSFGVDRGLLERNVMLGVAQLWSADHADEIWTRHEEIAVCAKATPEVAFGLRLANLTGLRRADLVKLTWTHVGDHLIRKPTSKSRNKRAAFIPILVETRDLLDEIARQNAERIERWKAARRRLPPEALTVLTNTRGRPWSADGFETQIIKAKAAAGVAKRLHDARGTFVTRLKIAGGLTNEEIAEVMAWEKDRVDQIIARYVDGEASAKALAERIRRNERSR